MTAVMETPIRKGRKMKKTFKGWICAELKDAALLESMGFVLGEYDDMFGTFENCVASEAALAHISHRWGEFIWDLKPVEMPKDEAGESNITGEAGGLMSGDVPRAAN
jgi:hypothetical protein